MNPIRTSVLTVALAAGLAWAGNAPAQTVGYNIRTGDVWVDSRLGEINDYGNRYRDPFISEMTGHYGAPRSLIEQLLGARGWAPADVYYACAIARALGIPCLDVVREYDRDPDQGWGAVAKRMGIKPGSDAFHALKRGTVATYDRWGYPVVVDRNVRVDWSQHGPGSKGKDRGHVGHGNNGNRNGNGKQAGARGNSGKGNGNGGQNKGNGKGKGNGRG